MQAITTKYIPASNFKGARISVYAQAGRRIYSWDDSLGTDENHAAAAKKFADHLQWHTDAVGASETAKRKADAQRKKFNVTSDAGSKPGTSQAKNVVDFPQRQTACEYDPEKGDGIPNGRRSVFVFVCVDRNYSCGSFKILEARRVA